MIVGPSVCLLIPEARDRSFFYRIGLNLAIRFPSWVVRSIFLDFSKNNFLAFLELFFDVFKVILSTYTVKISYFLADSHQTWYLYPSRRWKKYFFSDFSKKSFLAFLEPFWSFLRAF